jgi:hypothetical protein
MPGPFLDPLGIQTPLARSVLRLFAAVLLGDSAYLRRLQAHHRFQRRRGTGRDAARRLVTQAPRPAEGQAPVRRLASMRMRATSSAKRTSLASSGA